MNATRLTGAEAFVETLVAAGTTYVFGNPGTTEQAFLDALGARDEIELVVALHEGVAVGAAEGYARASGNVGVVQLHTGCGLGNAMGMLSNADAGETPLVVYVGGATARGAHTEPALGGDLVAMARPVARWAWEVKTAAEIPVVVARAFKVALTPPMGPVVIAVPNDLMDEPCDVEVFAPSLVRGEVSPSDATLRDVVELIRSARSPALLIGDGVGGAAGGRAVARLAELIGAPIFSSYVTTAVLPDRHELDAGELPLFDAAAARTRLADHDLVVAIGAVVTRSVFPVAGPPLGDVDVVHIGADAWQLGKTQPCMAVLGHPHAALDAIMERLDDTSEGAGDDESPRRHWAERRATVATDLAERRRQPAASARQRAETTFGPDAVMAALADVLGSDTVLVDEAVSAMGAVSQWLPRRPDQWFRSRGGGLGAGMSVPVGAALSGRSGRVVALVGDGAAMYTVTALWTAARWNLPITWIILDNGGYRILEANTRTWRAGRDPERPIVGTELGNPSIDFSRLAESFGVTGRRVTGPGQLREALPVSLSGGPALVHVVLQL